MTPLSHLTLDLAIYFILMSRLSLLFELLFTCDSISFEPGPEGLLPSLALS